MSKLEPGDWKAALTDWGVVTAKTGSVGVKLQFAVACKEDLVEGDKIYWLTDKAKQKSIERLYALGFNGDLEALAKGREGKALTGGSEVMVACANEDDGNGGQVCKIQFVNLPGETHGLTKLDAKEGASKLAGLKADFLSFKPATKKKGLDLT